MSKKYIMSEWEKIRVIRAYLTRYNPRQSDHGAFLKTVNEIYKHETEQRRKSIYHSVKRFVESRSIYSLKQLEDYVTKMQCVE